MTNVKNEHTRIFPRPSPVAYAAAAGDASGIIGAVRADADAEAVSAALIALTKGVVLTPDVVAWACSHGGNPEPTVRWHLARLLSSAESDCADLIERPVARLLADEMMFVRRAAASAAAQFPGVMSVSVLERALPVLDPGGRRSVVEALDPADSDARRVLERLAADDPARRVRWRARKRSALKNR
jgi:hypothetical protein